jgi:hypothetical protein
MNLSKKTFSWPLSKWVITDNIRQRNFYEEKSAACPLRTHVQFANIPKSKMPKYNFGDFLRPLSIRIGLSTFFYGEHKISEDVQVKDIPLKSSVLNPHHVDADPDSIYHPDADPDSDILFDAAPDPDHPDADPDPGPDPILKKGSNP